MIALMNGNVQFVMNLPPPSDELLIYGSGWTSSQICRRRASVSESLLSSDDPLSAIPLIASSSSLLPCEENMTSSSLYSLGGLIMWYLYLSNGDAFGIFYVPLFFSAPPTLFFLWACKKGKTSLAKYIYFVYFFSFYLIHLFPLHLCQKSNQI